MWRGFFYGLLLSAVIPSFSAATTPAEILKSRRGDHEQFRTAVEKLGRGAATEWVKLLSPGRPNAERAAALDAIDILFRDAGLLRIREQAEREVVPGILPLLDDPSGWIRSRAMNTLRNIGPPAKSAVPKLIAIMRDQKEPAAEQFSTREAAALALGDIREPQDQILSALSEMLGDPRPRLRLIAVASLRSMSWRAISALPALESAAATNSIEFKQKAAEAISAIRKPKPPMAGDPLPELDLATLDGAQRPRLADWKGKFIVIDFWSTTCPPCQPAMAQMQKVAATANPNKVIFIGICEDEDPTLALRHVRKNAWTNILHLHDPNQKIHNTFRAGLPELILADPNATILWRGHPTDIDLKSRIDALIKQN